MFESITFHGIVTDCAIKSATNRHSARLTKVLYSRKKIEQACLLNKNRQNG